MAHDNWQTPPEFFEVVHDEFGCMDLDAAATAKNSLCARWITQEENALVTPWNASIVWCNPPYTLIGPFVERGYKQSQELKNTVLMLLPAYTDPKYWSNYVMKAHEVRFLKGKISISPSRVQMDKRESCGEGTESVGLGLEGVMDWFKDWNAIGRATLAQLPKPEQRPFIDWLTNNPQFLDVYEKSPGEALRRWKDSATRYEFVGERMPYIKQSAADEILDGKREPRVPGELNYCFTREITQYLQTQGLSYQTINDILGALEGAKLEFYRRVVAPYETKKIQENGDIY